MTAPETRDDDDWSAALAGRPRAGASPATLLEAALMRAATRSWRPDTAVEPAADAEATLLRAAAAAGGCIGCESRRGRLLQALGSWRRPAPWAWALAGVAGVTLLLRVLPWPAEYPTDPGADQPAGEAPAVLRGPAAADGLQLLRAADPRAERDRLAAALRDLGAQVRPYDRLGRHGLEADWPAGPGAAASSAADPGTLAAALARLGLARGADGSVRLEVEAGP